MSAVQSKNIGKLCAELGFGPEFPGRESKPLTDSIKEFRIKFSDLGNAQPPLFQSNSPEARNFALAFCEEDNRASSLWPSSTTASWPIWEKDRSTILNALAHIFALQFFYNYQKEGKDKNKKKDMEFALGSDVRELSPGSRQYVAPLPPSGTKRRPAKKSEPNSTGNENESSKLETRCIEEIRFVDPRNDSKPVIKEFTKDWLTKVEAIWPPDADVRLRRLMHEENFYNADADNLPDVKILPIINALKAGTEIEQCSINTLTTRFDKFKHRVFERVEVLAKVLLDQGLIEDDHGGKRKTTTFLNHWRIKKSFWEPKAPSQKTFTLSKVAKQPNIYDMDSEPSDNETVAAKEPKSTSKVTQKLSHLGYKKPRPADDDFEEPTFIRRKRPKTLASTRAPRTSMTSRPAPVNTSSSNIRAEKTVPDGGDDQTEGIKFCQQFLDAPMEPEGEISSPLPENSTPANTGGRPFTPISSVELSDPPEHQVMPPGLQILSPSPSFRSPAVPSRTGQRLLFILQKAGGGFDYDLKRAPTLADVNRFSIDEFFSSYAERSGTPLEAIDCLTFTFTFAEGNDMVVHRRDQEAWETLQFSSENLFILHKRKTAKSGNKTNFTVNVEIGDKINLVPDEDDEA